MAMSSPPESSSEKLQSRSMAEPSHGFRRFLLDPKSSVMTYIANNIPSERPAQQQPGASTTPGSGNAGPQMNASHTTQVQPGQQQVGPGQRFHYGQGTSLYAEAPSQQLDLGPQASFNGPYHSQALETHITALSPAQIAYVQLQSPVPAAVTAIRTAIMPYPKTPHDHHSSGMEHSMGRMSGMTSVQNPVSDHDSTLKSQFPRK